MRVAFFGLPLAAWLLHRDGHEIVYAALSRPTPGTRRVTRVLGPRGVDVAVKPDVDDPRLAARVRALAPDLVVSWFWTTRLPMAIVEAAPLGAFGVHPSLLPRHRGPDPFFHAIDAGDAVTGVTAHRIVRDYDTGAILAQRTLTIDPDWNAWTLARALDRPSLALLRETARAFSRGEPPREAPQDESRATLAPQPADEDLELDWTWTSERLVRRVRAAAPWPGAFTFFGDECVTITRAAVATRFPRALAPGEAAVEGNPRDHAVVRTSDGALVLLEGRMESGDEDEPHRLGTDDLADLVRTLHTA